MFDYYILRPEHFDRLNASGCSTGWGNGYVVVPQGHWLHGLDYDQVDPLVVCPGGLTYSRQQGSEWVFGFDTAHPFNTAENSDMEMVRMWTADLARQLHDLENPDTSEPINSFDHCEVCGLDQAGCTC